MKNLYLFLLLSFTSWSLLGQQASLKKANKLYAAKAYAEAIPKYERALKKDSTLSEAIINIADCYRLTNNYKLAEKYYSKVVSKNNVQPIHQYHYGKVLMQLGNYREAITWLEKYKSDNRGTVFTESIENLKQYLEDSASYKIEKTSFNSSENDFSPVVFRKGVVFVSSRNNGTPAISRKHSWTEKNFYSLYYTEKNGASYVEPIKFSKSIETKYNDGPICFNINANEAFFTRNNQPRNKSAKSKDGISRLQLYTAKLVEEVDFNQITPFPFNSADYSCAHPCLSADEKQLYFSSDMPGGLGGMDLYVSQKNGNTWEKPVNLGPQINTSGNEVFPFINKQGEFFFSSDGLNGIGGLDIFKTTIVSGKIGSVKNVGAPINSSADDFSLVIEDGGKTGYFSSNRNNTNNDDDIYSFIKLKETFNIITVDEKTGERISKSSIRIKGIGVDESEKLVLDSGVATIDLLPSQLYNIEAWADKYKNTKIDITTSSGNNEIIVKLPKAIELYLNVLVLNNPKEKQPVASAKVMLNGSSGIPFDSNTDNSGKLIGVALLPENLYSLTATANQKTSEKGVFSTEGIKESKTFEQTLYLENIGAVCVHGMVRDKMNNLVPVEGAKLIVSDLATNEKIYETVTGTDGTYKTCLLELNKNYKIATSIPGYFNTSTTFNTTQPAPKKGKTIVATVDIEKNMDIERLIVGRAIKIDNIYFDLGKWAIRKDAAKELDKVVTLMKENSDVVIELGSHTDCRSSVQSNLTLSDKRAKASAQYIIDHGVDAKRIQGKGYGESQHVNSCACEGTVKSKCTEKEHQQNRRTEFKVIGFLKDGAVILQQ